MKPIKIVLLLTAALFLGACAIKPVPEKVGPGYQLFSQAEQMLQEKSYEKALEQAEGNNTLTAMATYGLALCEEEIGDFAKATEMLTAIVNNKDFKGTVVPAQAQFRLDVMADHEKQFTFVVAPKPELVIPKGFDRSAAEAMDRGDIYMADPPPVKVTPVPEVAPVPEVTPSLVL